MPIETGIDTIDELNANWPTSTDPINQGDDHLRLIKAILQTDAASLARALNTFAGNMGIQGQVTVAGLASFASLVSHLAGLRAGPVAPGGGSLAMAGAALRLLRDSGALLDLEAGRALIQVAAEQWLFDDAPITANSAVRAKEVNSGWQFVQSLPGAVANVLTFTPFAASSEMMLLFRDLQFANAQTSFFAVEHDFGAGFLTSDQVSQSAVWNVNAMRGEWRMVGCLGTEAFMQEGRTGQGANLGNIMQRTLGTGAAKAGSLVNLRIRRDDGGNMAANGAVRLYRKGPMA